MRRLLYSFLFWAFLVVSSVLMFPVAVVIWATTVLFDKRLVLLHAFTSFWANLYTWLNPAWPVTVVGREKLVRDTACVFVANHLSLLDILVLFRLRTHFKWVSKAENFRLPFIGWNMTLNRYIPLKRGDRESVVKMMRACDRSIARGNSIMMFPEGTRSPSGRMRSFKPGAFEIALQNRAPIQPIAIEGTSSALPKRGIVLRGRHPIRVTVLDAISPASFEDLSVTELSDLVRARIALHIGEEEPEPKRPLPSPGRDLPLQAGRQSNTIR
jgi:1-acyl-sn-glycerol-3-phosphate acyltransferase